MAPNASFAKNEDGPGQALKYTSFYGKNSGQGQVAKKDMIQSLAPEAQNE
jgi:hypothetical protein